MFWYEKMMKLYLRIASGILFGVMAIYAIIELFKPMTVMASLITILVLIMGICGVVEAIACDRGKR